MENKEYTIRFKFYKQRIYHILILSFVIFCSKSIVKAQTGKKWISTQTPNVSSLGTYGKIPVSLFTGTPNISIPLVELKGRNLNFPISISYHPGNIKPNERSGWVGKGWTIPIGVIYREVRGLPDEIGSAKYPNIGYYFKRYLTNSDWYKYAEGLHVDNSYQRILFHWYLPYYNDMEPDIFHFNINGLQGSFFFRPKWKLESSK